MRHLMVLFAGLCASTTTSLVVWVTMSLEPVPAVLPFVEIVDDSLVRTNLSQRDISMCLDEVLQAVAKQNGSTDGPSHLLTGNAWFSQTNFDGCAEEKTSRFHYRLPEVEGAPLRVEVIHQVDAATLIFIEHDSPKPVRSTAGLLAKRLQDAIVMGQ